MKYIFFSFIFVFSSSCVSKEEIKSKDISLSVGELDEMVLDNDENVVAFKFRDEALRNKSLYEYRSNLIKKIKSSNEKQIRALLEGRFHCAGLKHMLPGSTKSHSEYCLSILKMSLNEFRKRLVYTLNSGGCYMEKGRFHAPVSACYKSRNIDVNGMESSPVLLSIVGEAISVYRDADKGAKLTELRKLDVVRFENNTDTPRCPLTKGCPGWTYISSANGVRGFVQEKDFSKLLLSGYVVKFFKKKNEWNFNLVEYIH